MPNIVSIIRDHVVLANRRRLRRRGLIPRLEGTHRYVLTTFGLKVALFCTKLCLKILRPAWAAVETTARSVPHRLSQAFDRLTRELDRFVQKAQLKNLTQTSRCRAVGDA